MRSGRPLFEHNKGPKTLGIPFPIFCSSLRQNTCDACSRCPFIVLTEGFL